MTRHRQTVSATAATDARRVALALLLRVLDEGRSLSACLPPALACLPPAERPLAQTLCYGTLRWYPQLRRLVRALVKRPLHSDGHRLEALLALGCYQLLHTRVAAHAAIHESVEMARQSGLGRASGLVNAVLRRLQRDLPAWQTRLATDDWAHAHPDWLLQRLRADWPEDWRAIVAAGNARAPMALRVNLALGDRASYLDKLAAAGIDAAVHEYADSAVVTTTPCEVDRLPGFRRGLVSVQDVAAQLAAGLLDAAPGQRVLDACAAPGGKTCHVLERTPGLAAVIALDNDAGRLQRVRENLDRLGLDAMLIAGDAGSSGSWWDGNAFDRILLDAPCSATGVIRRHPDIKILRRSGDISGMAARQGAMLDALWPMLKPGGRLVYVTCSVLREENEAVVSSFLARCADACEQVIDASWGSRCLTGRQILPGEADCDGFYYAVLGRKPAGGFRG